MHSSIGCGRVISPRPIRYVPLPPTLPSPYPPQAAPNHAHPPTVGYPPYQGKNNRHLGNKVYRKRTDVFVSPRLAFPPRPVGADMMNGVGCSTSVVNGPSGGKYVPPPTTPSNSRRADGSLTLARAVGIMFRKRNSRLIPRRIVRVQLDPGGRQGFREPGFPRSMFRADRLRRRTKCTRRSCYSTRSAIPNGSSKPTWYAPHPILTPR